MSNNEENKLAVNESAIEAADSLVPETNEATDENLNEDGFSEDELASLDKTQLASKLDELLTNEDEQPAFATIKLIKIAYDKCVAEEYQTKLKIFMEDGSLEEDFSPAKDPLDEKVNKLYKSFNKKRANQRKEKEKSLQENLSTKILIVEELKDLLKNETDFSKAYHKFQALQNKWRATGHVPKQEVNTLTENHYFLTGKFYEMIKINNELRELDRKKNLEIKHELCDKAEKLAEEPSLKKALDELKFLQEEWRASNNLNKQLVDALWQRFKTATDKIIERKKEHIAKIKQRQQANLVAKTALCEQLEQLATEDLSSHKLCRFAAEKAELIWVEWQKIGFVPKGDDNNCWKRFKKARQHFHQLLDSFYAKQRSEFGQNLEKKVELCVKAEALQDSTDWASTANALKRLQSEWKDIGPVATKDSQKIWERFRKACDHFFENKNKELREKENALLANVSIKTALITKLEQLSPTPELEQSLELLKIINEEWAASGAVPMRENDKLNTLFGKAVESFLEKIKDMNPKKESLLYRLKYEQMLKYPQGQEQVRKERLTVQDKIKKLEATANQLETNLSFFGNSKKANPILDEYRTKLDETKLELTKLNKQLNAIPAVQ